MVIKMQYKRWYDKNEALKQIIEILESSDPEMRSEIANDIIQLIINKQYDFDNFIQVINNDLPLSKNRWYDQDDTTFSAVEMLKTIDPIQKNELFKEILNTIINMGNE